jgi:L-alanine-DL-glutamate epimerase-like enolase superfamily enzyme
MKITDLKCAIIGGQPTIRIATDTGLSGYGQIEWFRPFIKEQVLFYKDKLIDEDPRDVERVMLKIRRLGGFKPWGSAVSAIEMALWDVAGKAAGLPLYRLLGGKVRDQVRVYLTGTMNGDPNKCPVTPEEGVKSVLKALDDPGGYTLIKSGVGFHSPMPEMIPGFFHGEIRSGPSHPHRGPLSDEGFRCCVEYVETLLDAINGRAQLALDCGPGWTLPDAIRFAKALEGYPIAWLEDLLTGDYNPNVSAAEYRELTQATSTPTHTGEQIYLRHGFRELIETHAVRIIGPDPLDVGGFAELKWIAEYADMHGILMAPHSTFNGVLGLAASVQTCATLPDNFVAFEYCKAPTDWWWDIVDGLPDQLVVDGHIKVWDSPGLGVTLNEEKTRPYLRPEDQDFFD